METQKHNLPTLCALEGRPLEYGGGIVHHEVPLAVGKIENHGNVVARVSLGGQGGTSGQRDDVEALANLIVRACNNHYKLVEAMQWVKDKRVRFPTDGQLEDMRKALAEAEAA